ncbi:hypothetical protein GSI_05295 [Ganoderma sinense ZZ0214-1]|uniref:Uncharacterized protein n=1 Tax=Ganoderma sinense ZZ0214-1 TaxID=1077348 RepID=A0A2G8SFQ1_9APHY|nr:hypothetical protein GSI_05295 [Ganoderma sinense ZZ0214-1]
MLPLVVTVQVEEISDAAAPTVPGGARAPASADSAKAARSKGKQPATAPVLSKGKKRAAAPAEKTNSHSKRARKEPRQPSGKREAYQVQYIREGAKDEEGKLWEGQTIVASIRAVRGEGRILSGKEMHAAVELVGQLLETVIDVDDAPRGLKGQRVTGKSIAIFLNVSDNWFGIAKKIYGELVVSRENPDVAEYLEGMKSFGVGVNSVYRDILAITEGTEKEPSPPTRVNPVTRPNKRKRVEEPRAGSSKFGPDHDGQGYTEIDDDDDDEQEQAEEQEQEQEQEQDGDDDDDDDEPTEGEA